MDTGLIGLSIQVYSWLEKLVHAWFVPKYFPSKKLSPTSGGHAMAYLDHLLADSFQIKLFTDACGSDQGLGCA